MRTDLAGAAVRARVGAPHAVVERKGTTEVGMRLERHGLALGPPARVTLLHRS
jgi:hypothetical protein